MVHLPLGLQTAFAECDSALKTARGTASMMIDFATQKNLDIVKDIFTRFFTKEFAATCGYTERARNSDLEKKHDQIVADCMLTFASGL
eukprot:4546554-Lingulodinium_polyedra.AAC.1